MVLKKVDLGRESLDRQIPYGTADLLEYAPATRRNVARGYMTVRELLFAMVELSDNTAANLCSRRLADHRIYTHRHAPRGRYGNDSGARRTARERPAASRANPRHDHAFGDGVRCARHDRRKLSAVTNAWPAARLDDRIQTGLDLLRAGFPPKWTVGDKTGLGGAHNSYGVNDTRNDVAIAWAPTGGANRGGGLPHRA